MFSIESSAQLIQPSLFEAGSLSLREGVADCHNAQLARRFGRRVFDISEAQRIGPDLVVELSLLITANGIGRSDEILELLFNLDSTVERPMWSS